MHCTHIAPINAGFWPSLVADFEQQWHDRPITSNTIIFAQPQLKSHPISPTVNKSAGSQEKSPQEIKTKCDFPQLLPTHNSKNDVRIFELFV
mmetsp:Transcript_100403/g.169597  ORF Transcript_100403/g.169597 Transcript_100403/m.169597 type:complete len:92 (+) Transcript_100403:363-638(+)